MSAWPYLAMTGAAALAAGAAAVPALRRGIAGDVKRDWLQGELDLDRIAPDGRTVHLKSGGCLQAFRLSGQPYETKPLARQEELLLGREAWLNALGEKGVAARLFGVKREIDASADADWPSPTLREVAAAEAEVYRRSYEIAWFVVLATGGDTAALLEASRRTGAMLADYGPEALVRAEADCPLTGFLNGLACGDYRSDLPGCSANVSAALPASDLAFGRDGSIVANQPVPARYRVVAVRAWPETVSGEIAAAVMALPGELEWSQVALPLSRDKTVAGLARKKNELRANFLASGAALTEHAAMLDLLADGKHLLFSTQAQLVLRGRSDAELDALTERVAALLAHWRVGYSVETAGAPVAWFNRLPSPGRLMRPLRITNRDVAALWPWHHAPVGQGASPWGDAPVRLFRTGGGQSYAFQFHVSAKPQSNGHYLVFAPTGAGKTTLLLHLLGGLAKFSGVRAFVFDSREGARFGIEALGGVYQPFERLRLNPLDVGGDTLANRQRIAGVMRSMLGAAGEGEDADAALKHALDVLFTVDPPERTFDAIYPVAFARRSAAQRAFSAWVTDVKGAAGHYAHVFNAPRDGLAATFAGAWLVGINMNEILSDEALGPPAVAHMSAAISQSAADTSGFNIFIDEAANLLRNPGFRDVAAEMFREYRKLNGAVGLAFQDPAALLSSGVAEALIENAATLLFFPNALATRESYAPFHLNDEQLEFVLSGGAAGAGRRVLAVKRDAATGYDESAILDVDLAPLGAAARLYRSGPDAVEDLLRLQRNHGGEWIRHV